MNDLASTIRKHKHHVGLLAGDSQTPQENRSMVDTRHRGHVDDFIYIDEGLWSDTDISGDGGYHDKEVA